VIPIAGVEGPPGLAAARPAAWLDPSRGAGAPPAPRLGSEYMIWLTTVGPDGVPQPSGVWFHWDGEDILIFSEPDAPKVRNIRRNPHVALNLDGDGTGGALVIIAGVASILSYPPDALRLTSYRQKYAHLSRNNLGADVKDMLQRFNAAILVTPTRYLAHGVSGGGPKPR
jgi:PPOX class probable F420-dependent enzyme